jgi:glucosyl-3-phosphoglycerate synthase
VRRLAQETGLVDEIVVIDSGSVDRTAEVAAKAGAVVRHRDDVLPHLGSYPGKGEVLWKALHVTRGDIVVYVDSDLTAFGPHYVTGLLGPLLGDPSVLLTKAFYDRPLLDISAAGGGRVTELMARPLFTAYFPELAGVVQPLAGEYAARRSLLDTAAAHGLDAVAQVDLGHRTHGHQDTEALGRMAATILRTVVSRVDPGRTLWPELTQFRRNADGDVEPHVTTVTVPERPPMITVPEYRATRP